MSFQKQKTPIKCEDCGYTWQYKGKLRRTTCPNCGSKTKIPIAEGLKTEEDPTSKMIREYLDS